MDCTVKSLIQGWESKRATRSTPPTQSSSSTNSLTTRNISIARNSSGLPLARNSSGISVRTTTGTTAAEPILLPGASNPGSIASGNRTSGSTTAEGQLEYGQSPSARDIARSFEARVSRTSQSSQIGFNKSPLLSTNQIPLASRPFSGTGFGINNNSTGGNISTGGNLRGGIPAWRRSTNSVDTTQLKKACDSTDSGTIKVPPTRSFFDPKNRLVTSRITAAPIKVNDEKKGTFTNLDIKKGTVTNLDTRTDSKESTSSTTNPEARGLQKGWEKGLSTTLSIKSGAEKASSTENKKPYTDVPLSQASSKSSSGKSRNKLTKEFKPSETTRERKPSESTSGSVTSYLKRKTASLLGCTDKSDESKSSEKKESDSQKSKDSKRSRSSVEKKPRVAVERPSLEKPSVGQTILPPGRISRIEDKSIDSTKGVPTGTVYSGTHQFSSSLGVCKPPQSEIVSGAEPALVKTSTVPISSITGAGAIGLGSKSGGLRPPQPATATSQTEGIVGGLLRPQSPLYRTQFSFTTSASSGVKRLSLVQGRPATPTATQTQTATKPPTLEASDRTGTPQLNRPGTPQLNRIGTPQLNRTGTPQLNTTGTPQLNRTPQLLRSSGTPTNLRSTVTPTNLRATGTPTNVRLGTPNARRTNTSQGVSKNTPEGVRTNNTSQRVKTTTPQGVKRSTPEGLKNTPQLNRGNTSTLPRPPYIRVTSNESIRKPSKNGVTNASSKNTPTIQSESTQVENQVERQNSLDLNGSQNLSGSQTSLFSGNSGLKLPSPLVINPVTTRLSSPFLLGGQSKNPPGSSTDSDMQKDAADFLYGKDLGSDNISVGSISDTTNITSSGEESAFGTRGENRQSETRRGQAEIPPKRKSEQRSVISAENNRIDKRSIEDTRQSREDPRQARQTQDSRLLVPGRSKDLTSHLSQNHFSGSDDNRHQTSSGVRSDRELELEKELQRVKASSKEFIRETARAEEENQKYLGKFKEIFEQTSKDNMDKDEQIRQLQEQLAVVQNQNRQKDNIIKDQEDTHLSQIQGIDAGKQLTLQELAKVKNENEKLQRELQKRERELELGKTDVAALAAKETNYIETTNQIQYERDQVRLRLEREQEEKHLYRKDGEEARAIMLEVLNNLPHETVETIRQAFPKVEEYRKGVPVMPQRDNRDLQGLSSTSNSVISNPADSITGAFSMLTGAVGNVVDSVGNFVTQDGVGAAFVQDGGGSYQDGGSTGSGNHLNQQQGSSNSEYYDTRSHGRISDVSSKSGKKSGFSSIGGLFKSAQNFVQGASPVSGMTEKSKKRKSDQSDSIGSNRNSSDRNNNSRYQPPSRGGPHNNSGPHSNSNGYEIDSNNQQFVDSSYFHEVESFEVDPRSLTSTKKNLTTSQEDNNNIIIDSIDSIEDLRLLAKKMKQEKVKIQIEKEEKEKQLGRLAMENEQQELLIESIKQDNEVLEVLRKENEELKLTLKKLKSCDSNTMMQRYTEAKQEAEDFFALQKKANAELDLVKREKVRKEEEHQKEIRILKEKEQQAQAKLTELSIESKRKDEKISELRSQLEIAVEDKERVSMRTSKVSVTSETEDTTSDSSPKNVDRKVRDINRITVEREKLLRKLDDLNAEQSNIQSTLDKDKLLGDSVWLRDIQGASTLGGSLGNHRSSIISTSNPNSAIKEGDGGKDSKTKTFKHEFKCANLLEGETMDEIKNPRTSTFDAGMNSIQLGSTSTLGGGRIGSNKSTSEGHPGDDYPGSSSARKSSPQAIESEEMVEARKSAFKAVGRDDLEELKKILELIEPKVWLSWLNGAGDALIKMADSRKRTKCLHHLRKAMGTTELTTSDREFEIRDNVWVFRELGDPQPEQGTVRQVMPSETGDPKDVLLYIEYWSSVTKNEFIPAVRCRLMLRNSWEEETAEQEN